MGGTFPRWRPSVLLYLPRVLACHARVIIHGLRACGCARPNVSRAPRPGAGAHMHAPDRGPARAGPCTQDRGRAPDRRRGERAPACDRAMRLHMRQCAPATKCLARMRPGPGARRAGPRSGARAARLGSQARAPRPIQQTTYNGDLQQLDLLKTEEPFLHEQILLLFFLLSQKDRGPANRQIAFKAPPGRFDDVGSQV